MSESTEAINFVTRTEGVAAITEEAPEQSGQTPNTSKQEKHSESEDRPVSSNDEIEEKKDSELAVETKPKHVGTNGDKVNMSDATSSTIEIGDNNEIDNDNGIDNDINSNENLPESTPENLGAQILKNRFLSLKDRANQNAQSLWAKKSPALSSNAKAVQERAGQLWKAAPRLPAVGAGFRNNITKQASESVGGTETKADNKGPLVVAPESQNHTNREENDKEVKPNELSLTGATSADNNPMKQTSIDTNDHASSSSSSVGASDVASRIIPAKALTKATLAASAAYESVSTFRGRYNSAESTSNDHNQEFDATKESVTDSKVMPESQIDLILKSRAGDHMQEILAGLDTHEYAMLLGRGMLGVNLKQCYLKNHGVFVDFMVPGGQAEQSGVVCNGDLLVRLGDTDLRKGTILNIPSQIAEKKRPVVLTLATGSKPSVERINYVDIAVAMMHRARKYYTERGSLSNLPSATSPTGPKKSSSVETVVAVEQEIQSVSKVPIPTNNNIVDFLTPPRPSLEIQNEFADETSLRNLENFAIDGLVQVLDMDINFRGALRNAFLTCALDVRKLSFLSRHFSSTEQDAFGHTETKMTPSAQLMLFLELSSFIDLYDVTPKTRLREIASKIAFKFFLPTAIGETLQPPLFDFHHMVSDSSLRKLEKVLSADNEITHDVFLDFTNAVVDSLAGAPFVSFLTSSECSRMRAYLRDTAPHQNLALPTLLEDLITHENSLSIHRFSYILLFLICQMEKEPSGEYNFGNDIETKKRLLGAPNDICCGIFIRRELLPLLERIKQESARTNVEGEFDSELLKNLMNTIKKFWNTFIVGTMAVQPRRDALEGYFNEIRKELNTLSAKLPQTKDTNEMKETIATTIALSPLYELATTLAEELLFNFVANIGPKFREHKFHEWLCSEALKIQGSENNGNIDNSIPSLPQGCIKRLLRKADLPDGISSHKPHKKMDSEEDPSDYPNAEFAVVFGSKIANDLDMSMSLPRGTSDDIVRYTSLPVSLDQDICLEDAIFLAEKSIPSNFESYAKVSPKHTKSFSKLRRDALISHDGWEVSLVSFTVPNAESSGADSSLFGVSLFFQCKPEQVSVVRGRVDELVCEKATSMESFQSPIKLQDIDATDQVGDIGSLGRQGQVKNVSVSQSLPGFNEKLKSSSWVSRILGDEFRDASEPVSIGLALVSRKNVIPAMRDTLSNLLFDYSQGPSTQSSMALQNCGVLVDVLGNFCNEDIENTSLRCILEPYLRAASAPWLERPVHNQAAIFEKNAVEMLCDCLPPAQLALMFLASLLEQKIVLSSSRRSLLQATSIALGSLLDPLKWSHLMVPFVPDDLARDLIQYPAPFILGILSEHCENAKLLESLPRNVTLVDLDVGRVILAPDFGLDNEMVIKADNSVLTANALRSQVLNLAQSLGEVFGNKLKPQTWQCDVAFPVHRNSSNRDVERIDIEALQKCATEFIAELLEGVSSCCYWLEEKSETGNTVGEPTVLFDEDKFFEVKRYRGSANYTSLFDFEESQHHLALTSDFDLVLKSVLRCQSISTYISSQSKTEMIFY